MDESMQLLESVNPVAKKNKYGCFGSLTSRLNPIITGSVFLVPFAFIYNGTFKDNFSFFPNPQSEIKKVAPQNWVFILLCTSFAVINPLLNARLKIKDEQRRAKYEEIAQTKDVLERVQLILSFAKESPVRVQREVKQLMDQGKLQGLEAFIERYVAHEYDQDTGKLDVAKFTRALMDATGTAFGLVIYILLIAVLAVDVSVLGSVGEGIVRYGLPSLVVGLVSFLTKGNYDNLMEDKESVTARGNIQSIMAIAEVLQLPDDGETQISEDLKNLVRILEKFKQPVDDLELVGETQHNTVTQRK